VRLQWRRHARVPLHAGDDPAVPEQDRRAAAGPHRYPDIHVEAPAVPFKELRGDSGAEPSSESSSNLDDPLHYRPSNCVWVILLQVVRARAQVHDAAVLEMAGKCLRGRR